MNGHIAKLYDTYRQAVIPPTAPAVQLQECEQAFFSGAYALLVFVHALSGDVVAGKVTEAEGIVGLSLLRQECEAYFATRTPPNRH